MTGFAPLGRCRIVLGFPLPASARLPRSEKLKRQQQKAKTNNPAATHSRRFQRRIPEKPSARVFLSATVQYFVISPKASFPKGSTIAASFSFSSFCVRTPATMSTTSRHKPPRNETTLLRVSAAMVNMMAAIKMVFGNAKARMPCRCADHTTGPNRSASDHGITFASSAPTEMPTIGIEEMTTEPRNLPTRKSILRMGLVNTIWCMSYANSRAAAELAKAVTMSRVMNQKME